MKNLLVFASAVMVGAAAFASVTPRVYQYSANLTTAVAKNASKVSWSVDGETYTDYDVCYRVKGKVAVKAVMVFGCDCLDYDSLDGYIPDYENNQFILAATSADKYAMVTFAEGYVWNANRLGNPLSSKAKVAELGFDMWFVSGPTNEEACVREFGLWNAGFGKASSIESSEDLDISSISGNVVGWADAPYCAADANDCPRCLEDGVCSYAIAFEPCAFEDPYDYEGIDEDVVYGSFSLKFNKSLSTLIKPILASDVQGTINALVPKAFGSKSVAPTFANIEDYFHGTME